MQITPDDIILALSVTVIDSLLSVDNALANAAQAAALPVKAQNTAIRFGMVLGAVFRVLALFAVQLIVRYPVIKLVGALWLFWLAAKYFWLNREGAEDAPPLKTTLTQVIVAIGITDLTLSVDNVVAAVGMTQKFSILVIGVLASIVVMTFATQLMAGLLRRYPNLEKAAYIIIAFIGVTIILSDLYHLLAWAPHYEIKAGIKFAITLSIVAVTILVEEAYRRVPYLKTRRELAESKSSDLSKGAI